MAKEMIKFSQMKFEQLDLKEIELKFNKIIKPKKYQILLSNSILSKKFKKNDLKN